MARTGKRVSTAEGRQCVARSLTYLAKRSAKSEGDKSAKTEDSQRFLVAHSSKHSHYPGQPPKSTVRPSRDGQVERVLHHILSVHDQTRPLTQVGKDERRVNEEDERDPDGSSGKLSKVGAVDDGPRYQCRLARVIDTRAGTDKMASHPVNDNKTPAKASKFLVRIKTGKNHRDQHRDERPPRLTTTHT